MMNFCTYFDSYYFHKGVATYLSLERVCDDFTLYVMAFDKESYNKLKEIGFKHMVVALLDDIETSELRAVKPTRSKAEYCWTCGPSCIYHFLKSNNLDHIAYIDSDLIFFNTPQIILDEIGSASVGITEHFFPSNSNSDAGKYCVQYVYFKNDEEGVKCLEWWRDRCIEWCYSRREGNKYGDQGYLESFPILFKNVHVVENRGVGIAPWNMMTYTYDSDNVIFNQKKYPMVFFHMNGLAFDVKRNVLIEDLRMYDIDDTLERLFFLPYANLMREVYVKYIGKDVESVYINKRSTIQIFWSKIRHSLRDNPIARFFYFKLLNHRYNGFETKKL